MSELDCVIPPEIKNDEFYYLIQRLARTEKLANVLEIGSSAGGGSTEAFVTGLRENPDHPKLFCLEISKPRFAELQARYQSDPFVRCYNASSVPATSFPTREEVQRFYESTPTVLNQFPLARVLGWLDQDLAYIREWNPPQNGIDMIKKEHGIRYFDLVLIDGSEFSGEAELQEVYGARIICLDDVNAFKNFRNYHRLKGDPHYALVTENWSVRNGFAIFHLVRALDETSVETSSKRVSPTPSSSPSSSGAAALTKLFLREVVGEAPNNDRQGTPAAIVCSASGSRPETIIAQASDTQPAFWQTCQIVKERCGESPGIIILGHGDAGPTPERVRALEQHRYLVISGSCSRDDNVAWLAHPLCIGALVGHRETLEQLKTHFPHHLFERLNFVMLNFMRTATQQPGWMANLAGLPLMTPPPLALKTIDVAGCWTSVPLKRTELLVETALAGGLKGWVTSQEFGTRPQIVRAIEELAGRYSLKVTPQYLPFEQYALLNIGDQVIVDGRPIGINNGHFSGVLDRTKVYLHTSETEGIPNSILEALMRNVPVVICRDVQGPMRGLAAELGNAITVADPDPRALADTVRGMIAQYDRYASVRESFRTHFDPFEVNRRLAVGCQDLFQKRGLPWRGNWLGLMGGMTTMFDLAHEVPGFEQYAGQRTVWPNFEFLELYLRYQRSLAERAGNGGAASLLDAEWEILSRVREREK